MPQQNVKLPPGYEDATSNTVAASPGASATDAVKLPPGYEDAAPAYTNDVEKLEEGGVITPKPNESFRETMMRAANAGQHVSQDTVDYSTKNAESTAPFVVGGLGAAAAAPELAAFLAAHPDVAKTVLKGLGYGASFGAGMSIWHVLAHIFGKGGGGGGTPPVEP